MGGIGGSWGSQSMQVEGAEKLKLTLLPPPAEIRAGRVTGAAGPNGVQSAEGAERPHLRLWGCHHGWGCPQDRSAHREAGAFISKLRVSGVRALHKILPRALHLVPRPAKGQY